MLSNRHRRGGLLGLAMALLLSPGVHAQDRSTLTLQEAIELARRNNPDYLAQANDIAVADWAVRDAYGALLPGASASTTYGYQAAGTPRFGNFTGNELGLNSTTDYYSSSYSLGLSYRLSGSSLLAPGQARSQRNATAAGIEAAAFNLTAAVTRQYISVRRAHDGVTLAQRELERADENLRLAQARVDVGAAIPLEVTQAEVERGRSEVALLQAENLVRTEQLRLMQSLGVRVPGEVELTTSFAIHDVPWTQEQLVSVARSEHPQLRAARASATAADAGVKMARSAYLPSLSLSAGISGYARQAGNTDFLVEQGRVGAQNRVQECERWNQWRSAAGIDAPLPSFPANCASLAFSPDMERQIRDGNSGFPFGYSRDPYSVSMTLSLPLFDGLSRERQVEQARVARSDAELRVRSEELRIETEVGTALHNVQTARLSAQLEARNAELAEQQLTLARERYRVGAASFLELQDAETAKARADRAQLTAQYQFHESVAALEAAVGRPLMQAEIR